MTLEPFAKQYPNDIDAEYGLIGCVICDNTLMSHLGFLSAEHFYSVEYSSVFSAMTKLYGDSQSITPFTIKPLLDEKAFRLLEEAGGAIKHLAESVSASLMISKPVQVAKELLDLSRKRELAQVCDATAHLICNTSKPIAEYAGELTTAIERLNRDNPLEEFQTESQVINEILEDLKDEREPFSTGLSKLDEAMGGGLFPGKSYGFAAKKKMGKTMLAGTVSMNLNAHGIKHLFICAEMSPKEIHQRSISRSLGRYPSAFRNSYGSSDGFIADVARLSLNSKNTVLYRNAPGLTFDELRRVCRNAVERHRVTGIIIDYWQLVGGKAKNQSTSEHLDEVAQWIADFGRKTGTWMFVLAQINQEGNTRGGEGIRLAFDQVYHLRAPNDDPSLHGRWVEMMDTRYTKWINIGSDTNPGLQINEKGLFFEEI